MVVAAASVVGVAAAYYLLDPVALFSPKSHLKTQIDVVGSARPVAQAMPFDSDPDRTTDRTETDETVIDEVRADPYGIRTAPGYLALSDIQSVINEHYTAARRGDPESLYQLYQVAWNCRGVVGFDAESGRSTPVDIEALKRAWSQTNSQYHSYGYIEAMGKRSISFAPACNEFVSLMPGKFTVMDEWLYALVAESADRGSAIGKLEMLSLYEGVDVESYGAWAKQLEDTIQNDDYRIYEKAYVFFTRFRDPNDHDDSWEQKANQWRYLSCQSNPNCDTTVLENLFKEQLHEYELDEIVAGAMALRNSLGKGMRFSFSDYNSGGVFLTGGTGENIGKSQRATR